MNPHQPVFEHYPTGETFKADCAVKGCYYVAFAGEGTDEAYGKRFYRDHAIQYEPGHAPNIEVDWEPSADCPFCEYGGKVEVDVDGEGLRCAECGTTWGMDGRHGERAEVTA